MSSFRLIGNLFLKKKIKVFLWVLWYNDSAYAESKPDRRIFDRAFERAGCEAHEAAMLGDRLDNDICPAKKLGMKTIRIKQGFAAYQSPTGPEYEADYTVNNLKKLLTIL